MIIKALLPGFPEPTDVHVLDGDSHISKWVRETGRLDHDQASLTRIARFIKPDSVVYDVGAFIGDHTAFYCSLRPRSVIAFEPYADAFQCLVHNTGIYKTTWTDLYTCSCGLGDGTPYVKLPLEVEPNRGARHLIAKPTPTHLTTLSTPLDDLIEPSKRARAFRPPTLIKIDAEGWEVRILRGAMRTLARWRPHLVIEVNRGALERAGTSTHELFETLTVFKYEVRDIFTGELWHPRDDRPQLDVVAFPL